MSHRMSPSVSTEAASDSGETAGDASVAASDPSPTAAQEQLCDMVAELNNEGACQLENGLYTEAVQALTSGLRLAMTSADSSSWNSRQRAALNAALALSREGRSRGLPPPPFVAQRRRYQHPYRAVTASEVLPSTTSTTTTTAAATSRRARRRRRTPRRQSMSSSSKESAPSSSSVVLAAESTTSRRSRSAAASPRRRRRRGQQLKSSNNNETDSSNDNSSILRSPKSRSTTLTEDMARPPQKRVYSKALRVVDRYSLPSLMELTLYLLYNMALVHHLQAIADQRHTLLLGSTTSTKQGTATWQRIAKLYKATTAWQEASSESVNENEELPIMDPSHTLGLFNNLACAYHASGNDKEADETWQVVLNQLWCMLDVGLDSDEVESIHETLENAAHLLDPRIGCTATAA